MRHLKISLLALVGAIAFALVLATIGSTGLAPAISSALLMGATVGVVTFLILDRMVPAAPSAEAVSSAIPDLDADDEAMRAAALGWDSRPDPFAVGWEAAQQDPVTGETELRAWEDWTSTLSGESAAAPVWADEPRTLAFDFKRWLPASAEHDTVELPLLASESSADAEREPELAVERVAAPSNSLRLAPTGGGFPDFAPWPDAPWRAADQAGPAGGEHVDA